ncbi:MAG TPA: hypothetical protein VIK86_00625 [Candidatus Paceibacterota bacterium]
MIELVWKYAPFKKISFHYSKDKDCCYCPIGQQMDEVGELTTKTKAGFIQRTSLAQAKRSVAFNTIRCYAKMVGKEWYSNQSSTQKKEKLAKELLFYFR